MATYVLVHGATAGGWYMRPLADRLRAAGHDAFTPTLTGLGERSHLATPEVDLGTHIKDITNVLYYEDLRDVVLIGKSYGGMVITGVAERMPERLAHLVYVDAFVPRDGQALADMLPAELVAVGDELVRVHGEGWQLSLGSDDPRITPQPYKTFKQPVLIGDAAAAALPRTYIRCTQTPAEGILAPLVGCAERARAEGWNYRELPSGHEPERDMPEELASLPLELG